MRFWGLPVLYDSKRSKNDIHVLRSHTPDRVHHSAPVQQFLLGPILPDLGIIEDATIGQVPGGAFESEDLPDPPGLGFICPGNRDRPARDGDLDLAALSESGKTSRIPAEQDAHPVAKCWRGGNRCSCYGSTGRSCYGSPSGRSPVDC